MVNMKKDREKEINYLIYLKSELIKATKKEIKELQQEKQMIQGYKKLIKKRGNKNGRLQIQQKDKQY